MDFDYGKSVATIKYIIIVFRRTLQRDTEIEFDMGVLNRKYFKGIQNAALSIFKGEGQNPRSFLGPQKEKGKKGKQEKGEEEKRKEKKKWTEGKM